jgi:hypothetical protein
MKPSFPQSRPMKLTLYSFYDSMPFMKTVGIETIARCLVTSSPRLSNDALQLIDLCLRTAESTELFYTLVDCSWPESCSKTYPLLGQLTRTLVLAVSEKFDNTTLIWCQSIPL